jgi:pyruvate/2-oxoglutarate dehydrogenase complex dihydrolipoamide dehydrogenase (E3) component
VAKKKVAKEKVNAKVKKGRKRVKVKVKERKKEMAKKNIVIAGGSSIVVGNKRLASIVL